MIVPFIDEIATDISLRDMIRARARMSVPGTKRTLHADKPMSVIKASTGRRVCASLSPKRPKADVQLGRQAGHMIDLVLVRMISECRLSSPTWRAGHA